MWSHFFCCFRHDNCFLLAYHHIWSVMMNEWTDCSCIWRCQWSLELLGLLCNAQNKVYLINTKSRPTFKHINFCLGMFPFPFWKMRFLWQFYWYISFSFTVKQKQYLMQQDSQELDWSQFLFVIYCSSRRLNKRCSKDELEPFANFCGKTRLELFFCGGVVVVAFEMRYFAASLVVCNKHVLLSSTL